jgi:hypothetical protein
LLQNVLIEVNMLTILNKYYIFPCLLFNFLFHISFIVIQNVHLGNKHFTKLSKLTLEIMIQSAIGYKSM